ncbi:MAG: XRE family transcriptional regulator [Pseudomonadota bacterium]
MTIGATGFVGQRLAEARQARGIAQADFAALVGLSPQSMSKYENDKQNPTQEVVDLLASHLRFPRSYFFLPYRFGDDKPIFWRSKLTAPKGKKEGAKVRLDWVKSAVDYLCAFLDFSPVNVPLIDTPSDIALMDDQFIEEAAASIREQWEIAPGPMPDVLERMELNGIFVSRIHVRAEKLDAFSQWSDHYGVPFVVLSRDKASACRQRFDALHELAHLVLHRSVTHKQMSNASTYKLLEKQADKLASALLLPERDFLDELYAPSLDAFVSMKSRWKASVGAMIMRAHQLDIISDDYKTRLWMNYTRRGYKRNGEPLDNSLPKEEPHMIRAGFMMLLESGRQTKSDILSALPFPADDLEEIADLEQGTLSGETVAEKRQPKLREDLGENVVSIFGD